MQRTLELIEEAGVTSDSLRNAEYLLRKFGKPEQVDFKAYTKRGDYFVTATWPTFKHTFSGFSWGYSGEGPRGLEMMLSLYGIGLKARDLPIDSFNKTDCSFRFDSKFSA